MDLLSLLSRHEGKTLEFKREVAASLPLLRTVSAFANTAGGVLLIGIEDRTRRVTGVKDPLAESERVADLIADGISPQIIPSVEILSWRRKNVVAVEVPYAARGPAYVKTLGLEKGTYIRVGSTVRLAAPDLRRELSRLAENIVFDEMPVPSTNSEEIDFGAVSELFKGRGRRLGRSSLASLRLTSRTGGKETPTVGGLLLFGRKRLQRFPDAWVQVGRFRGSDRTEILDSAEIRSYLPQAVEEAAAFVVRNISRRSELRGVERVDRYEYPTEAIREAIVNAIVHADYSLQGAPIRIAVFGDRFEATSPGLLPFGLTIEDILAGTSKVRNRVIARVFQELGLVEQWGSGIPRMRAACRAAGLREPHFEEFSTFFRVTIYSERARVPQVDDLDDKILAALNEQGALSTSEVAGLIGRTTRTARTRLLALVRVGLVAELARGPTDPRRTYVRAKS